MYIQSQACHLVPLTSSTRRTLPLPHVPFPMLGHFCFQGPMLLALSTDLAEQRALRLIYICPQPASSCIGPSFPFLSTGRPTLGLRISQLSRSVIPGQTPLASLSVLLLPLPRCCAAARQDWCVLLP